MARGFAEQSGGALAIDSAPGLGTTVSLWLPEAPPPEADAAAATGAAPAPVRVAAGEDPRRRPRVLLVDDEDTVRALTAEGLRAAGLAVAEAAGAAEALALLSGPATGAQGGGDAAASFDILVSDLSMPGTDGLALIREAQRRRPRLPAVLLTGFATDAAELAVRGAVSSSFTLLRKPVDPCALADRVVATVEGARSSAGERPFAGGVG